MPEKKHNPQPQPDPLGTGARALAPRPSEEAQTGRIIEDYAELSDTDERGHTWAPVHQWAIALDDGRLIFATATRSSARAIRV